MTRTVLHERSFLGTIGSVLLSQLRSGSPWVLRFIRGRAVMWMPLDDQQGVAYELPPTRQT